VTNETGDFMTSNVFAEPHLVLAWGTVRYASFPDRVEAAAAAGFQSIGMALDDYRGLLRAGWTDAQLRKVLDDHGITIDEVEVLFGFAAEPGPAHIPERPGLVYADPELEKTAWRMADAFGVRRVQAVGRFQHGTPGPDVATAFGELCDRAGRHAIKVALEFVPYTDIPDIASAAEVVRAAGRANGGLCVDTWHFFRGPSTFADLAGIDRASVFMVQVNDGPAQPADLNRMADAVHNRRSPGYGEFELEQFFSILDGPDLGDCALSVEVYSDELHRRSSRQAAEMAAAATRAVLAGSTVSKLA